MRIFHSYDSLSPGILFVGHFFYLTWPAYVSPLHALFSANTFLLLQTCFLACFLISAFISNSSSSQNRFSISNLSTFSIFVLGFLYFDIRSLHEYTFAHFRLSIVAYLLSLLLLTLTPFAFLLLLSFAQQDVHFAHPFKHPSFVGNAIISCSFYPSVFLLIIFKPRLYFC